MVVVVSVLLMKCVSLIKFGCYTTFATNLLLILVVLISETEGPKETWAAGEVVVDLKRFAFEEAEVEDLA